VVSLLWFCGLFVARKWDLVVGGSIEGLGARALIDTNEAVVSGTKGGQPGLLSRHQNSIFSFFTVWINIKSLIVRVIAFISFDLKHQSRL